MRDAVVTELDGYAVIATPQGHLYTGLPTSLQVYFGNGAPGGRVRLSTAEPSCFVWRPASVDIMMDSHDIAATEHYERYAWQPGVGLIEMTAPVTYCGPSGHAELIEFYRSRHTARFDAAMLDGGVFAIYREDGRIAGACGTHFVNRADGVAMIGFLEVSPQLRGRSLGRRLMAAVTAALINDCDTIVCDIAPRNVGSQRAVAAVGFTPTCTKFVGEMRVIG